jgi:tRNA nucleotidyltransferase/poly(A) polymerase
MEGYIQKEVPLSKENFSEEIMQIESRISAELPIDELSRILPSESYLIGGSIRDVILDKSVKHSDLDIYTRGSQADVIDLLVKAGYLEISEPSIQEKEYFFDEGGEYVYLYLDKKRVEIRFIGNVRINELISQSDINLNCCAYDINSKSIVDSAIALSVKSKKLQFSSPNIAKQDPLKILSALKQIARLPDIVILQETEEIIKDGIKYVYEYFLNNPEKRQKLKSLLCEINSSQAIKYFSEKQKYIFEGLETKSYKLNVTDRYASKNLSELSKDEYKNIQEFVKEKYGKRFDPLKLGSRKVNSVVFNQYENGSIKSCCLFDGLRLYAIASNDLIDIVEMVQDLVDYNYSIWTTISADHKLLIALSVKAGLKIENNKEVIHKILSGQYPNYLNNIDYNENDNMVTFTRNDSGNPEQVLLRN